MITHKKPGWIVFFFHSHYAKISPEILLRTDISGEPSFEGLYNIMNKYNNYYKYNIMNKNNLLIWCMLFFALSLTIII